MATAAVMRCEEGRRRRRSAGRRGMRQGKRERDSSPPIPCALRRHAWTGLLCCRDAAAQHCPPCAPANPAGPPRWRPAQRVRNRPRRAARASIPPLRVTSGAQAAPFVRTERVHALMLAEELAGRGHRKCSFVLGVSMCGPSSPSFRLGVRRSVGLDFK